MKERFRAGMALHIVMCLVAVMLIIATAMTGLSMMNLDMAQAFSNGTIAMNEAEAAVSKLLYNVSENRDFGLAGEQVRGTITEGMSTDTCYHLITFDKNVGYPWSVNGKNTATTGYMGRSVPKETIHVVATGFCRGQYRSIEALIYRPPFPYALASTGRIFSAGHMFVEGARSSEEVKNSKLGRPGHVLSTWRKSGGASPNPSNPDDYAIYIGDASGSETFVSGFILAAGDVLVKPRATVKEGIVRNTDGVEIPNIAAANFRNEGGEGVIRIVSDSYAGPQKMDAMYYCNHSVTFAGTVELCNAFLYVEDGDLVIGSGLRGKGAIVVKNGSVMVKGDTALSTSNSVALICDGDVALEGNNNYFQGFVYTHGNMNARDITVVGNLIMDGRASSGAADDTKKLALDNVTCISNSPETGAIAFTAQSSTDAQTSYANSNTRLPNIGKDKDGRIGVNQSDEWWVEDLFNKNGDQGVDMIVNYLTKCNIAKVQFSGEYGDVDPSLKSTLDDLSSFSKDYQATEAQLKTTPPTITVHHDTPPPGHDETKDNPDYLELVTKRDELKGKYDSMVKDFARACLEVYKKNTNSGCTYNTGGKTMNVTKHYSFDLNEFLPVGSELKVMYWHVFGKRL